MKVIIKINSEYKLNCSIVDKEGNERIIQDDINPCLIFNLNTIDFIKQWIEKPEEFKTYTVEYQNKSYELLPEVLFAIIIYDYKKKIEKEYIIENTEIQIPNNNSKIMGRIKI